MKLLASALLLAASTTCVVAEESMDKMWGESIGKASISSERVGLFRDGNYGMFIHWGLFSHLGGQWKDTTFYGIGEWIKRQMKIPDAEYQALAKDFNPSEFDAKAVAAVAKAAGMKWIIITSKHHEGFAMFKSQHPFNIVDTTPFKRDPMQELAQACKEAGLGFGFYYSHNQDWTAPGGNGGPDKNPDGSPATFAQYFKEKCYPQVKEICTQYGQLAFVWFDTPGSMPKENVLDLVKLVNETQPNALMCSRVGHGLGDYASKGDMEVPLRNIDGLWETCDTTNDSWSYAWYDANWKDSKAILHRLVNTIGRGGTYLLNIGLDGKGRTPPQVAKYLAKAGDWIRRYPEVVYGAGPSPWGQAMPWGDVTTQGKVLNLTVFDWPADGRLCLPGLKTPIAAAAVSIAGKQVPVTWKTVGTWTEFAVPVAKPDAPAGVVRVLLQAPPEVDQTIGIQPNRATDLLVEFAKVAGAEKKRLNWMEKFGEWKFSIQAGKWTKAGTATWTVDVAEAGEYHVSLTYRGNGKTAWRLVTDEQTMLQNQQNGTAVSQAYPFGVLSFAKPGQHTITISLAGGDAEKASLEAVHLSPVE